MRLCLDYFVSTLHKCENKVRQPRKERVANGWTSEMSMLLWKFQMLLKSPFWLARKGGLNGVNRQSSNGLKFNRQPSKNLLPSIAKTQININRQNVLRYFKSLYFCWSSWDSGSWTVSKLGKKNASYILENTLSRHYKTTQHGYIWKYFEIL